MVEFCKAKEGEIEDIIDFINMVFSMNGVPHQFKTLLPKLYGEKAKTESFHYIAREKGKIRGVIGSFPIELSYGENRLKCAMIGSVSVHPSDREKGYMKNLMELAMADMQQQGMAFSCLSGQRQRYTYYGYEKTGYFYHYFIQSANIKHCSYNFPKFQVELREIEELGTTLELLHQLYEKKNGMVLRDKSMFFEICKSWNAKMIGVWLQEKLVGYLCISGNQILEYVLEEEKYLVSVLEQWLKTKNQREIVLKIQPHEWEKQAILNQLAEQSSLQIGANYKILDYKQVLNFYFQVKTHYEWLEDGELYFEILKMNGEKERIAIKVKEGNVVVSEWKGFVESFVTLSETEFLQIVFTPFPIWEEKKRKSQKYGNWFPLPLGISEQDLC